MARNSDVRATPGGVFSESSDSVTSNVLGSTFVTSISYNATDNILTVINNNTVNQDIALDEVVDDAVRVETAFLTGNILTLRFTDTNVDDITVDLSSLTGGDGETYTLTYVENTGVLTITDSQNVAQNVTIPNNFVTAISVDTEEVLTLERSGLTNLTVALPSNDVVDATLTGNFLRLTNEDNSVVEVDLSPLVVAGGNTDTFVTAAAFNASDNNLTLTLTDVNGGTTTVVVNLDALNHTLSVADVVIGDPNIVDSALPTGSITTTVSGDDITFTIGALAVGTSQIAGKSVTGGKIADSTLVNSLFIDNEIDGARLKVNSIPDNRITDASLIESKLNIGNDPQNDFVLTADDQQAGGMIWKSVEAVTDLSFVDGASGDEGKELATTWTVTSDDNVSVVVVAPDFTDTASGLVPFPGSEDADAQHYLVGDGSWDTIDTFTSIGPGFVPAPGNANADADHYLTGAGLWADFDLDALSDVTISVPVAGEVLAYNGTNWVDTSLSGGTGITATGTTIAIDTAITAQLASPTFTGTVTVPATLVTDSANTAATKGYVDVETALLAPLASPTFTGTVTVPTTQDSDADTVAASKGYVDGEIPVVVTNSKAGLVPALPNNRLQVLGGLGSFRSDGAGKFFAADNPDINIYHPDAILESSRYRQIEYTTAFTGVLLGNLAGDLRIDTNDTVVANLGIANSWTMAQTFDGGADLSEEKITNLADPTDAQDAATKQYVDDNSGGGDLNELTDVTLTTPSDNQVLTFDNDTWVNADVQSDDLKANLASPTFTGDVVVPTPDADNEATTKLYVDTEDALKANLASPTFTGTVTVPETQDSDADTVVASKGYVDTADALLAPLANPTFTGDVVVPTPDADNEATTKLYVDTEDALKANLASPTFTGDVVVPTPDADNEATTKLYVDTEDALKANLASPTFTGVPLAPTADEGTDTTQIATTAFVLANSSDGSEFIVDSYAGTVPTALGDDALAIGDLAKADANDSIAIGRDADISDTTAIRSIAIGSLSEVTGASSVAIGRNASVTVNDSVAIGHNATSELASEVRLGGNVGLSRVTIPTDRAGSETLPNELVSKSYVDNRVGHSVDFIRDNGIPNEIAFTTTSVDDAVEYNLNNAADQEFGAYTPNENIILPVPAGNLEFVEETVWTASTVTGSKSLSGEVALYNGISGGTIRYLSDDNATETFQFRYVQTARESDNFFASIVIEIVLLSPGDPLSGGYIIGSGNGTLIGGDTPDGSFEGADVLRSAEIDILTSRTHPGGTHSLNNGDRVGIRGRFIEQEGSDASVNHFFIFNKTTGDGNAFTIQAEHQVVDNSFAIDTAGNLLLAIGDTDITVYTASTNLINSAIVPEDTDKADLASPDFTGVPTAPTADANTDTTQIATTAFVLANQSGGGNDVAVQEEGTEVDATLATLNFVGDGVTAALNGEVVDVTIPGGGGGTDIAVQEEGTEVDATLATLNFVGDGVTAALNGEVVDVTIPGGGGGEDYVSINSDGTVPNVAGTATDAIAIGESVTVGIDGVSNVAIGIGAQTDEIESVAIGASATAQFPNSGAIGANAAARAENIVTIGGTKGGTLQTAELAKQTATDDNDLAIATKKYVDDTDGEDYLVVNSDGTLPLAAGSDAIALGESSSANGDNATAIGTGATADFNFSAALGNSASATKTFETMLGADIATNTVGVAGVSDVLVRDDGFVLSNAYPNSRGSSLFNTDESEDVADWAAMNFSHFKRALPVPNGATEKGFYYYTSDQSSLGGFSLGDLASTLKYYGTNAQGWLLRTFQYNSDGDLSVSHLTWIEADATLSAIFTASDFRTLAWAVDDSTNRTPVTDNDGSYTAGTWTGFDLNNSNVAERTLLGTVRYFYAANGDLEYTTTLGRNAT